MDTSSTLPEPAPQPRAVAPATPASTRPFFWSLRRELWESRSLYVAPLAATGVLLVAFVISMAYVPPGMPGANLPEPARQIAGRLNGFANARSPLVDTEQVDRHARHLAPDLRFELHDEHAQLRIRRGRDPDPSARRRGAAR